MTIQHLLHVLGRDIAEQSLHFAPNNSFAECVVLGGRTTIDGRAIYVGTAQCAAQMLDERPNEPSVTVVTAGSCPGLLKHRDCDTVNLIITALDLAELCNRVYGALSRYQQWIMSMKTILYERGELGQLMDMGAKMLNSHIFLLNAGFKLLAYNSEATFQNLYSDELLTNGYLSYESIKAITEYENSRNDTNNQEPNWIEYDAEPLGQHVIMHLIKYKSNVVARLLVITANEWYSPAIGELAKVFRKYVESHLIQDNEENYRTSNEFSALVGDLIETRITTGEELAERLKLMSIHIKKFYHCIVIEFENHTTAIPYGQVIQQLEQIFSYSNIAIYKGDILVLARKVQHYVPLEYDKKQLNQLLTTFGAHASIGNYSKWLTSLRPIYQQTKAIIKYARVLCPDPGNRIYYYEDYSMYHIIGLLADNCYDYHRNNLVYLCHPGMMALEKYDIKYGTNYREIAFAYMMNDRNLSKTAKDLYLHRNTMTNKINQIEDILGEKLDNGTLQQRLLFSAMVLNYVKNYEKDDLFRLKR